MKRLINIINQQDENMYGVTEQRLGAQDDQNRIEQNRLEYNRIRIYKNKNININNKVKIKYIKIQ